MKSILKKPIIKTEREKALEKRIAEQKKEIKFQAAALNEVNAAVNAVLSSIVRKHGYRDGDNYVLIFPKPDINDGYEVKTTIDKNGFYHMTARKVEKENDCEPDVTERTSPDDEAAEKTE